MDDMIGAPSVVGRLLSEISWSGSTIREYRDGGRGFENVLTAEALLALDFLPRAHFLGAVLGAAVGADRARAEVIADAERIGFSLLPGSFYLRPSASSHQTRIAVQPDGLLRSPRSFVVIEAKRLRVGSFQARQLAREYALALQRCGDATPLLLLLLPAPPPVPVRGLGRVLPDEAIRAHLAEVWATTDEPRYSLDEMLDRIPEVVAWITWDQLLGTLLAQRETFATSDASWTASIHRLVGSVSDAIAWHR